MNVMFETICVILTLAGQIYVLDALSLTEIDWIFLDNGGLDESFLGLSQLGGGSQTFFTTSQTC